MRKGISTLRLSMLRVMVPSMIIGGFVSVPFFFHTPPPPGHPESRWRRKAYHGAGSAEPSNAAATACASQPWRTASRNATARARRALTP